MAMEVSSSASELRERIGSLSISQGYSSSSEEAKFTAPQNTREFTIRRHHPTLGIIEKTFRGRFAECMARHNRTSDLSAEEKSSEDHLSRGRTLIILPDKEVPADKKLKQREYNEWMVEILTKEKFESSAQGDQGSTSRLSNELLKQKSIQLGRIRTN